METLRKIFWGLLGAATGLIFGALCGFAVGMIKMPASATAGDGLIGLLWILSGCMLGTLVGFALGLCVPSWQHNFQRKKRFQTLRKQRRIRSFQSPNNSWPPPPKSPAEAGTQTIADEKEA